MVNNPPPPQGCSQEFLVGGDDGYDLIGSYSKKKMVGGDDGNDLIGSYSKKNLVGGMHTPPPGYIPGNITV